MKAVGVGWGTVYYHVRNLARNGAIQAVSTGYQTRLFPRGHVGPDPEALRWVATLRNDIGHSIMEELDRAPDLTVRQLADRLEIPDYSVRRYLRHLEDGGIVTHEPAPGGATWRARGAHGRSVPDSLRVAPGGQDYRTRL